ncbi:hypothetical protein IQ276_017910 [Desmonostoc muscorum LEGE 12446]|uniref:Uncharacterized protein n=1 Tax=Desmonostoc muscorum LEGE 12446 TaxID=1828758 RepID=A0A8J7ABS9_DESMC|nr:hypothetical protein [Desmonostoc muscorum]MCF2148265.1 hypothetical protein [Desmonostoc muscorum LEGE 12446]
MFTRSELEIKTIRELRDLCRRYGIKPTGNPGYKTSYITSLMAFPQLALHQMQEGRGLKPPSFATFQCIGAAIDEMNSPTDEQIALIRMTLEGRRMSYPDRFEQEKLLNLHKAKMLVEQAFAMLSQ